MSLNTFKILIAILLISLISSIIFIIYQQHQISVKQETIDSQAILQKQLSDNIIRSLNEFASKKDLEQYLKDNNINIKTIQEDLNKFHATVSAVNVVKSNSQGQNLNNIPSTSIGEFNNYPQIGDPFGYEQHQQVLSLNENFANLQIPIGNVKFSAWQEKPWAIDIKPREYHITNIIGQDENQRLYVYNKFSISVDNKVHDIKISSSETKQEFPSPKFSFWNPNLFLGLSSGVNISKFEAEAAPSLNLGIMSYGKFKKLPDISVLQVGAGYQMISKSPEILITPISYNLGNHIPLTNNLYVGPSVNFNFKQDFAIMAGIRVGL